MKSYKRLVQPYVVWISIFLIIPMVLIVLYAISEQGNDVLTFHFTFDNFIRFFQDTVFLGVLFDSFRIALVTTIICILIGYPAAYLISKMNVKHNAFFILLITLPMWINMLVRTYAWVGILSDNGVINHLLGFFGLGKVHMIHTEFAVILGMVYNFVPFMILQIHASLAKMDKSLIEASNDLGANRFETFRRITLPLSLPGVISGITLVFLPAVSSFFIQKLLGGGTLLIGNLIENYFITTGDWNFGSAISLIMAIIIMISMFLTNRLDKDGGDSL
ncbi:ABC transporter permease [Breznakia pachnodae]|uniref:Spermidine/putrescine transport system permease protein n=1 Tax=Breznakia pachnodae TaxID=265178 RepID=A0ABU0E6S2_9FIRM|nr:ABC transporter permease [Breznakia pachnodae]MDQ0362608.1 spermidine/putrescine transport system permease protein [Breznakia pachnodae]